MQFEWNEFEQKDSAGKVTGYGISWTEARVWVEATVLAVSWLAFVLAFGFGAVGVIMSGPNKPVLVILWIALSLFLAGVGVILLRKSWRVPGAERWVVFGRDGSIRSSETGVWRTQVCEIACFEWEEQKKKEDDGDLPYTHGVRMVTRKRRVVRVAQNLEPEDAGTLAYALSEANERAKYGGLNGFKAAGADAVW